MLDYKNNINLKQLDSIDEDYICGGANICENIDPNYAKVSPSQRCNCGQFIRGQKCGNIDICDNCIWAQAPYLGSDIAYCSKQVVR